MSLYCTCLKKATYRSSIFCDQARKKNILVFFLEKKKILPSGDWCFYGFKTEH